MTKRELLENYRSLVREIELLDKQSDFLNQYVGGPRPVRSVKLTGMPRGTNEPEAALMQRVDYNDTVYELERKSEELRGLLDEFNIVLDSIEDGDDRNILRAYYALNWTDKRIGEWLGYDTSTIWRRRQKLINLLSLQTVHIATYCP
jgi:hypothetical protein